MDPNLKATVVTREVSRPASAEQRLKELGMKLPAPPEPFGIYVQAVRTGNLLFSRECFTQKGGQSVTGDVRVVYELDRREMERLTISTIIVAAFLALFLALRP
jgi:hypothetical protein